MHQDDIFILLGFAGIVWLALALGNNILESIGYFVAIFVVGGFIVWLFDGIF